MKKLKQLKLIPKLSDTISDDIQFQPKTLLDELIEHYWAIIPYQCDPYIKELRKDTFTVLKEYQYLLEVLKNSNKKGFPICAATVSEMLERFKRTGQRSL